MTEEATEAPVPRDDEKDDASSLLRLVQAYCNKHPGGTVLFAIATSGSDRMKLHEMGDPGVRAQMATQHLIRARAAIEQMERVRIARPGDVMGSRAARALLESAKRAVGQGG